MQLNSFVKSKQKGEATFFFFYSYLQFILGESRPPLLISPISLSEKDINFNDLKETEKKKSPKSRLPGRK